MEQISASVDERRPSGWRSTAFDALVGAFAIAVELRWVLAGDGEASVAGVVLAIGLGAALAWRRYAPLTVLALTLVLSCAIIAVGEQAGGFSPLVALYTAAVMRERPLSLAGLVPTVAVAVLVSLSALDSDSAGLPSGGGLQFAVVNAVLPMGIWGLGAYLQTRRQYLRELEERAAQLEREREQLAQIAVMEERTSIARELHDIVAHSVTVMLLGVRGARDVLRAAPDVADDTLARVEVTGEKSVSELRRILALLREPNDRAESRPQPSLADLEALVDEHRVAGLPVRLATSGRPRPLPEGVELSIYRIVQEALTNVVKHAAASQVTVSLAYGDGGERRAPARARTCARNRPTRRPSPAPPRRSRRRRRAPLPRACRSAARGRGVSIKRAR